MVEHRTDRFASLTVWGRRFLGDLRPFGLGPPSRLRRAPERVSSGRAMEPGLVTLAKIVGTMLLCMGTVPLIFLLAPGDKSEPKDDEHEGDHAAH